MRTNQMCVILLMLVADALLGSVPAMAHQIQGVAGSPSAKEFPNSKTLPPPALKFGGVINRNAAQSKELVAAADSAAQGCAKCNC